MDAPYPRLVSVEPAASYRLRLRFADGVEGIVDLSGDLWGAIFAPLTDPAYFAQVRLGEDSAPVWPHGLDLAPDALYEELTAAVPR
ncbi:MAG TPA: DUF2442 domain-containing protein [Verrucomicrobiae bacterium]|nr:DUF2442 domain-containing protein [Verrucomicrobiae bacterium]